MTRAKTKRRSRAERTPGERRRRCTRCGNLYPPGELAQPSRGERLCEHCLLEVANEAADAAQLPLAEEAEPLTLVLDHGTLTDGVYTEGGGTLDELDQDDDVAAYANSEDEEERMLARAAMYEQRSESIKARLQLLPNVRVPGWPGRHGRVSASSLGTFSRCPEQWRRRYVLGEREAAKGTMLTGSALHGAIEDLWHHKMREGVDLSEKEMLAGFDARFDWEVDDAGGAAWVEWGEDKNGELHGDDWRQRGQVVARAYLEHVAPGTWPLSAERLFVAHVPRVPIPVVGYIDFSTATEKADLKFGRNAKSVIGPEWIIQAHLYLLADDLRMTYQSFGWPGARGDVNYRTPSVAPGLVLEKTPERFLIAHQIVQARVSQILMFTAQFGTDQPWPDGMTHTWACSTCTFRPDCVYWHPRVVTL